MHLRQPPFALSPLARKTWPLLGFGAAMALSQWAHAEDAAPASHSTVTQLQRVVVVGSAQTEAEEAKEQLESVPGGTNFIDLSSVQAGKVGNNEDVLKYQPGIYAKASTNEGVKISIRGSGLNRGAGAHASGLYETIDGL